jgi:hypothetical protein
MDYAGIITTTAQSLTGYVVDGIHNGSVLPARFLTNPTEWDEGLYLQQPIQVEEYDNGGDFVGMPVMDVNAQNTDKNMQWLPKGKRESIVVPWAEVAVNKTKAGVIKLVARKMDVVKNALKDKMGNTLLGLGLGDAIEGLDLQTDNSSLTASYGNLDRATYGQVINGNVNTTTTTISLAALGTQMDKCTPANSDEGTTLNLTTKSIFGYVEAILDPKSRQLYNNIPVYVSAHTAKGGAVPSAELGGASGFTALFHRGIPMVKDEKVATGKMYNLNEGAMEFARLEFPQMKAITLANEVTEGVAADEPAPTAFQVTDMMTPYNQLGDIGHIIAYGNFINRQPNRSGAFTAIAG